MSASSSAAERMGGMFVVTQVIPAAAPQNNPKKNKFSQGRPEALGTVQIIIGLMDFLFGLVMLPDYITANTGVFVWGPLVFITAGSVTVAAGKRLNRCLVRTALGFNVVAAVASAVAIIIYSTDASYSGYHYKGSYSSGCVSCVLAVFGVLEFVVSICVAAFGCYDVCGSTDQPIIMINPMLQPASETQQALPNYANASPREDPPLYEAPTFPRVAPFSESTIESVTPQEYDNVLQSPAAEERHK
ncbi:membrane-spanning 4-domains subfamily A member 4A-like [Archocentrus centrarchus]|uniref:membrane-spanning 4-domains subfamily A member 4A-like n=1 Tax=Archocentrus centrarchus TaxID=63155 RepID=UPI0011EA3F48|nr:membrane-spanning 4-domains subfamily A member 4A-like [Archocentrus centrarchus]